MCVGCGADWVTDPAAKCYFLPRGENPAPVEPSANLCPSQFSPIFLARPSFLATVSVQPHPVPGRRGGEERHFCESPEWVGGGEGGERMRLSLSSWSWGLGGDSGRGEGYGTRLSLVAERGEMLKSVGQSVVWNSGAHFPTETKLKWRLAPRLAQRSQTQLIAAQPQKTLHLLHTLPLSVTGGAHRSSGSSGGRALVAVETGPRAALTQA